MGFIPNQQNNTGFFIPTTTIYDTSQINSLPDESDELKNLLVILYQNINNISKSLNAKATGSYQLQEFVNGKTFFNPNTSQINQPQRSNFSMTYYLLNLPPGVTTTAHNLPITSAWTFTDAYGMANDTVGFNYYPIASGSVGSVSVMVNLTNFVITNLTGLTFNKSYLTLEFLKN